MVYNSFKSERFVSLIFLLSFISSLLFVASCSDYQKVLKGADYSRKYEVALKLYNKKDYQRAYPLFEELVSVTRATSKAEDVYYYFAWCDYYLDDLVSASYHFDQFAEMFPSSPKAEETAYMSAYCYYRGSPEYSLDQTNSLKAIEHLQLFINKYPTSSRITECNDLIDKLRAKLEKKSFESAMLFYQTNDYKAAIVAFNNTLKEFPMTPNRELILFTILKCNFKLAENSVESKKIERYKNTLDAYSSFISKFATSKYAKEAEVIFKKASERMKLLN